jgi:hypothetical protein
MEAILGTWTTGKRLQKTKSYSLKEHLKTCIGRVARKPTIRFAMSARQFARPRKTAGF